MASKLGDMASGKLTALLLEALSCRRPSGTFTGCTVVSGEGTLRHMTTGGTIAHPQAPHPPATGPAPCLPARLAAP